MRTLIVTCMKNEGPFILEWLAYHQSIGVTDFLVYTNDCTDGTDDILDRLAERGDVVHERNDKILRRGVQKTALLRASSHPLRGAADWILVADVDEYVTIKTGDGTLDALRAAVPEASHIALVWRRFGANGVIDYRDEPITAQFTRAAPESCPFPFTNYGFKTLFRDDGTYMRLGVHRPLDPDPARVAAASWVDGSGTPLPPLYRQRGLFVAEAFAGYDLVQLNHYALRSAQSFLVKRKRGMANVQSTKIDLGYWAEKNFNTVEERSIAPRWPRAAERLAALKADQRLADLHQEACKRHRASIVEALRDPEALRLFLQIVMTESRTLSPRQAAALAPMVHRLWTSD